MRGGNSLMSNAVFDNGFVLDPDSATNAAEELTAREPKRQHQYDEGEQSHDQHGHHLGHARSILMNRP